MYYKMRCKPIKNILHEEGKNLLSAMRIIRDSSAELTGILDDHDPAWVAFEQALNALNNAQYFVFQAYRKEKQASKKGR